MSEMFNPADLEVDTFLGTGPRARWRRWLLWLVLAVGIVALLLLVARFVNGGQAATYLTETILRNDLAVKLAGGGALEPMGTSSIGAAMDGTVSEVLVKPGDRVTEGQVLARLDPSPILLAQARAQTLLQTRQAALAQAESAAGEANKRLLLFEGVRRQSQGAAPSDREMTDARNALTQARRDAGAARLEVDAARAAISAQDQLLAGTQIRSPAEGVVRQLSVAAGTLVQAASTAPLFVIAAPYGHLKLDMLTTRPPESRLAEGAAAVVTADALPGQRFTGRLMHIAAVPLGANLAGRSAPASSGKAWRLSIDVANPRGLLRPGMAANAEFDLGVRKAVLVVPDAALRFARAADADRRITGGAAVYVLDRDGAPRRIAVTVGGRDGRGSEVASDDLQSGMRVILGLR